MGRIVDICRFFLSRSLEDSASAVFGAYFTLAFFNFLCVVSALIQIRFLPLQTSWLRHRLFLLMVVVGCCIGIAAAILRSYQVYYGIAGAQSNVSDPQKSLGYLALSDYYGAWYYLLAPWETMFVLVAKLVVLERMALFAIRFKISESSLLHRMMQLKYVRAGFSAIIVLNLIGLCSFSAGAFFYFQSSTLKNETLLRNISDPAVLHSFQSDDAATYNKSNKCLSVHDFSECAMFLIIVVSFCAVGIHITKRIGSLLRNLPLRSETYAVSARSQGAALRRRVSVCIASIFLSFNLRFVWTLLNAVVGLADQSELCEADCGECQSSEYMLSAVLYFGSEIRAVVLMLSNPLALLICIAVMHSGNFRAADAGSGAALITNRDTFSSSQH
jgi:hypothetical protein